jgi:hypothetical protein
VPLKLNSRNEIVLVMRCCYQNIFLSSRYIIICEEVRRETRSRVKFEETRYRFPSGVISDVEQHYFVNKSYNLPFQRET